MNNILWGSAKDLLACFFTECESRFRFLEQKHDFHYLSGLVRYKDGRQIITPYRNQDVPKDFWAITRYEKDNIALEIVYGDEEFVIESYVYFQNIHRLNLSEILWAAKKDDGSVSGNRWASREAFLRDIICNMAASVEKHKRHILNPTQKTIDRAVTMRAKRLEENIREQYKKDLEKATTIAARAFHDRDFKRVLELLSPYEKDLATADSKKLMRARKNLSGQT